MCAGGRTDNSQVSKDQSREFEIVMQRFHALPPREQLGAYRAVRDYLSERIRETKRDRIVAERAAAVEVLAKVADHLNLPRDQAPSPAQFDDATKSLRLPWDRSRVQRAWGRWRFAVDALLKDRLPESATQRTQRRHLTQSKRKKEGHIRGVQLWLDTKPSATTPSAYRAWAREYNQETEAKSETPAVVVDSGWVARALGMTWPDVVRHARGDISAEQGRPMKKRRRERYSRGPYILASLEDVREILETLYGATRETLRVDFPAPVVVLPSIRLWLRDDVKAYKRGRRWSAEENAKKYNEYRHLYLTVEEVMAMTGLSRDQITKRRRGVPAPSVRLGFISLWLRSEIEDSPVFRSSLGA
jgi:predicted DNA-binding transcriptional regulator AlpA